MKYVHEWEVVKDTGKYQYLQCEKCGDKMVKQMYEEGHQPIDEDWRTLKRISAFCKGLNLNKGKSEVRQDEEVEKFLNTAISEINYALKSHKSSDVKEFYLENAIRFINLAKEKLNS